MGLRLTLEDILRISLRAGRIAPKATENINSRIFNGLCAPENLAALAVLYAEKNVKDFRNWLHEKLSEAFPKIERCVCSLIPQSVSVHSAKTNTPKVPLKIHFRNC